MIGVLKFLFCVLAVVYGLVSCNQSEWYQQQKANDEAALAEKWKNESTPRVIREADGCKVYAFKATQQGHWTYFTRCANSMTSTEASWEECRQSGKQRVCENRSSIVEGR